MERIRESKMTQKNRDKEADPWSRLKRLGCILHKPVGVALCRVTCYRNHGKPRLTEAHTARQAESSTSEDSAEDISAFPGPRAVTSHPAPTLADPHTLVTTLALSPGVGSLTSVPQFTVLWT